MFEKEMNLIQKKVALTKQDLQQDPKPDSLHDDTQELRWGVQELGEGWEKGSFDLKCLEHVTENRMGCVN